MFNLYPLFVAFIVVGAAELGDKTQLLTLGFTTRYPFWKVISAVFCATAVLTAAAVLLGGIINYYIPIFYIQLLAGVLFILFGIWIIFGKEKDEKGAKCDKNPFWIVFTSFLLAELGDKTQLATLTLSAKYGAPLQVWLGATLGMAAVNSLGAVAGGWIRKFVPLVWIKIVGAVVFVSFGLMTLGELFVW